MRRTTSLRLSRRRLVYESLETRDLLSGVTLITHGFNSSVDGWVTEMAQAIADRPDLATDQPRYRVDVFDHGAGTNIELTSALLTTPVPTDPAMADPEIVLLLNWTPLAGTPVLGGGYTRSTEEIAAAVAEKLIQPGFFEGTSTPLAELPLHLIGHSRGASLIGQIAHDLGLHGIWVDQVTTLDPHPVDGVREPPLASYDFGDADMTSWSNVAYWDNYWRTEGDPPPFFSFDFTGEPVANAHNAQLEESVLENGGYSLEHSDVHAWYHGTIDLSTDPPANNGDFDIPNHCYGDPHPDRGTSGYYFSRMVNGLRSADGLSADLGGTALRDAVAPANLAWPNLWGLEITADDLEVGVGESIPASVYHQDADSGATIVFYLDADRNPYNGDEIDMDSVTLPEAVVTPTLLAVELPTVGLTEGDYHLGSRITDVDGHTRYAYAPGQITLVVDSPPPSVVDIRFSGSAWEPQVPHFSVLADPEPEKPLPWINLDRIDVVLSGHAQVELDSLTLVGVTVPQYAPSGFQYDSDSFTATWEFSTPFPADKLLLDLPAPWTNVSPMVGRGAQASQVLADRFVFPMRVDILPGDSNRDRLVDIADLVNIATRVPSSIDPSPSP